MSSIKVEQWHELGTLFEAFFNSINGRVEWNEEVLQFTSPSDQVETSLSIYQNGRFAAAMPLHGIDAKVEQVIFNQQDFEIQLLGNGVDYVYRVPPQLLTSQGE